MEDPFLSVNVTEVLINFFVLFIFVLHFYKLVNFFENREESFLSLDLPKDYVLKKVIDLLKNNKLKITQINAFAMTFNFEFKTINKYTFEHPSWLTKNYNNNNTIIKNLTSKSKKIRLAYFLKCFGITENDLIIIDTLKITTDMFQLVGCTYSTDFDICILLSSDNFNKYTIGLLRIEVSEIKKWLKENYDKEKELDFTIIMTKKNCKNKNIIKKVISSKGNEKYAALTNNIIFTTYNNFKQPRSTSFIETNCELDEIKLHNNLMQYIMGVIYTLLQPYLSSEKKEEMSLLRKQYFHTDKIIIINKILEQLYINIGDFDKSSLKSLFMKTLQTILYIRFKEESYNKEELALKAETFLNRLNITFKKENYLYYLFRGKFNANKVEPIQKEDLSILFDEIIKIYNELNQTWIHVTINLFKCNLEKIILEPRFNSSLIEKIIKENFNEPSTSIINSLNSIGLFGNKISNFFETHGTPVEKYSNLIILLKDNINFDLKICSEDWKNALTFYKTGEQDIISDLKKDECAWTKNWHLFRGMLFESLIINNNMFWDTDFKTELEKQAKKNIINIKNYHIPLIISLDKQTGSVPDLVLEIEYDDNSFNIIIIEIKSIPFKFNNTTSKTKQKISLATKQSNKCKKIMNDIFKNKKYKVLIKTCLIFGDFFGNIYFNIN